LKKLFIILLGVGGSVFAQTIVKNIPAKRTTQRVIIDGKIDEAAWKDAAKFDELIDFWQERSRGKSNRSLPDV
jgi:hypothetical protein